MQYQFSHTIKTVTGVEWHTKVDEQGHPPPRHYSRPAPNYPPHWGHSSGSTSYTRLINLPHVRKWGQSLIQAGWGTGTIH